ncbi:TPA: helix-turn-helix domain-containing protein, partial [Streptococcus pyogenes]
MFNRIRIRFIMIASIAIFIILSSIVGIINTARCYQSQQEINRILHLISSNKGKLMAFLMLNQGKYLDTKTLYQHVWSDQEDYDTSIVWVYISYLRQKLLAIQANVIIAGDKDTSYCLL